MTKLTCLPLLAFASLGVVLVGCGSDASDPFGPDPDYASVQQRFTSPTGTVNERNMGSVFAQYAEKRSTSSQAAFSGATSLGGMGGAAGGGASGSPQTGGVQSKALQLLDLAETGSSSSLQCSALAHGDVTGSCSCPDGGSFDYDFSGFRAVQQSSGPIDASLKVRFEACQLSGVGIDGREFVHVHGERGGASFDAKSFSMLLIADFTVTKGAETHSLDLAAMISNGTMELAVKVDDGWVTIRATNGDAAGSFELRDRNGTWTCDVKDGAGTCKNANGETRSF
ncbi:MAG: hypothetical protein JWP87_1779 [Labilithrix sp.]|nr:hypothetical protein [Labilithrix sp.]